MTPRLVLASASPRRRALLAEWGVDHVVDAAEVDESFAAGETLVAVTERLAAAKAATVARQRADPKELVLGADTLVALGAEILAKPRDDADALRTLLALAGREVEVVTGIALAGPGSADVVRAHARSVVVMRDFDAAEARAYVATGEPRDKAGSFAIQGEGRRLVRRIEGSLTNVVGLPREVVLPLLAARGIVARPVA